MTEEINNKYIAMLMDKSYELIVSMIAIVKSGSVMVPLSRELSNDRIQYIIQQLGIKLVIIDESHLLLAEQLQLDCKIILVNSRKVSKQLNITHWSISDDQSIPSKSVDFAHLDSPAYVVYTSGTTGKPKGVPITHRNLYPLFTWQQQHFHLGPTTRTLQTLSPTFDFGLQEIMTTLLYGGELYFAEKQVFLNKDQYEQFIQKHHISMIYATPSFIQSLVTGLNLNSVKVVLIGGEIFQKNLVKPLKKAINADATIFNGYGPTEVTINVLMCQVTEAMATDPSLRSIPIGKPSANNIVYILNNDLKPTPIGSEGEIYLTGKGLTSGYIQADKLNQEKFISNPFNNLQKLYKTGDIAKLHFNGTIEFLSRNDKQVKIRGYRIELEDIQSTLSSIESIEQSVCRIIQDQNGHHQLVLYYVAKQDTIISDKKLLKQLSEKLPSYMLPHRLARIDQIPLNKNGKVDYHQLPAVNDLNDESTALESDYTEVVNLLITCWREVLGCKQITIMSNFFELGGHSLLIPRLYELITNKLNMTFPAIKIFEYPVLLDFANYLSTKDDGTNHLKQIHNRDKKRKQFIAKRRQFQKNNNKIVEREE